jgi:hypothetical protein
VIPAAGPLPGRLAYVVGDSYPWSGTGYALRVHRMAQALAAAGLEVIVFGRPGRPWDMTGFAADAGIEPERTVDGVRYVFLPSPAPPSALRRERLRHAEAALLQAFEVFRPALVLAASDWENAEPAQNAARRRGCPFWCEHYGFWERAPDADDPGFAAGEDGQRARRNALRVARAASGVLVQSAAMAAELAAAGIAAARLHPVPNGIAAAPARNRGPDRGPARDRLGCDVRFLIGHAGALRAADGAGGLVDLLARLCADGVDAGLLLPEPAAPGPEAALAERLRAQAAGLGLGARLVFVARPPGDRAVAWYRLADALVLARPHLPATALAAPPEPCLAAAAGVPLLLPDFPPHDEIAAATAARLYPAGDTDALVAALTAIARDGAVTGPLPEPTWPALLRPVARLLLAAAGTAPGAAAATAPAATRFDTHALPQVALRGHLGPGTVAVLGPGRDLPEQSRRIRLTRVNILAELATADPGLFVIDWAGLQAAPKGGAGEWAGLWGAGHMRLNRQVMDACRIALDRGWRVQVAGPVDRAQAPLYRTVAGVVEETAPGAGVAP